MISDRRRVAVALAGFAVFLNFYAPQSVLPLLARELGAGAGEISLTITASVFAVALIAPFTGTFADVVGRKRVIAAAMFALVVPTTMVALASGIQALVFWRFVQGLVLPPIFAVTVAYIAEEWPAGEAVAVTGVYTSAASFGGFFGRLITGLIADLAGWRAGFLALAALTLLLALGVAALLTPERRFVRSPDLIASARQMLRHLRSPPLVATYAIGFGVLFTFIATFTYVNFYLAAPPFGLSATALGLVFVVYLGGSVVAPLSGRAVARFGRRPLIVSVIAVWVCGLLLTLVASLPAVIAGLALCATCGFLCQTISMSFVALSAEAGHSSAVGLYVTCYYIGGSIGGALPGLTWDRAGWPGCVAMVIVVLILMAAIVWRFWNDAPAGPAGAHPP